MRPHRRGSARSRRRGSGCRRRRPRSRRASRAAARSAPARLPPRRPTGPRRRKTSTAAPRHRQEISPAHTGCRGLPPTNPVHTSVPPLSEASSTSVATASYTHRAAAGRQRRAGGAQRPQRLEVVAGARAADRLSSRLRGNPAPTPPHVVAGFGHAWPRGHRARARTGRRRRSTTAEPTRSPDTQKFHIIQPVVVYQKNRSSGPRSKCRPRTLACSSRMPPCPCTMGLGLPVVPEEKRTYSGWSKATGVNSDGLRLPGEIRPRDPAVGDATVRVQVPQPDGLPERGQAGPNGLVLGPPLDCPPAVAVAVDGQQHHRVDLGQPVEDPGHAHLRGAARPHRAEAGAGEHGRQGLGDVREVGGHPVTDAHAGGFESAADPADQLGELGPGQVHGRDGSATDR